MKVSKEQTAIHRQALVNAACSLIKENGFDGAGVAEISQKAGLTQGAFYRQFETKNALAAEACRHAFVQGFELVMSVKGKTKDDAKAYIDYYLSDKHLNDISGGCPMAAYAAEIRRQDKEIQAVFAEGSQKYVDAFQNALGKSMPLKLARTRAQMIVSALVGAVTMARAFKDSAPNTSKQILKNVRDQLTHMIAV